MLTSCATTCIFCEELNRVGKHATYTRRAHPSLSFNLERVTSVTALHDSLPS